MQLTLPLAGPSGEPVDPWRTLVSHGVAHLSPMEIDEEARTFTTTIALPRGRPRTVVITEGESGVASVTALGPKLGQPDALLAKLRRILNLDEDLSSFYAVAATDPDLAWSAAGAGRMLRSPTVFEDVVKTICTTNCAWSGTVRMVSALVGGLGPPVPGTADRRAFPLAAEMAEADESFYRDVARAGYRGPYLRRLAVAVAEGHLDLEALADSDLPDDEVAARLLAVDGVGPYALAHIMMLLGRYRRLILDSWTRPTYRRLTGRTRITDKGIERALRRYREFAGLAFWLMLTEDWVAPQ